MSPKSSVWKPRYTITAKVARLLMDIEAARAEIEHTPLPPAAAAELRRQAMIRSACYSTRIGGNRLTLAEAEQAILGGRKRACELTAVHRQCVGGLSAMKMPGTT